MQYYCALAQLTFLCSTVDVDSQFKTTMKSIAATASSDSSTEKDRLKAEGSVRGVVTAFVQAMVPVGASSPLSAVFIDFNAEELRLLSVDVIVRHC